jgi:hypothetical protein
VESSEPPGDKIGGKILEDRIDPRTRLRMLVLDVPRRERNVAVWISYPELTRLIDEAAPIIGERLGITFIGPRRLRATPDTRSPCPTGRPTPEGTRPQINPRSVMRYESGKICYLT